MREWEGILYVNNKERQFIDHHMTHQLSPKKDNSERQSMLRALDALPVANMAIAMEGDFHLAL